MIHNITNEINLWIIERPELVPVSSGWFGSVSSFEQNGKKYAVKEFKETMLNAIGTEYFAFDYDILNDIGESIHFPTIHAYKETKWMMVDFIDGITFRNVPNKESYRSQLIQAYEHSVSNGWFPDDIKGDNLVVSNGNLVILDVGAFLPVTNEVDFDIGKRVDFVIRNGSTYPSVRDSPPYEL